MHVKANTHSLLNNIRKTSKLNHADDKTFFSKKKAAKNAACFLLIHIKFYSITNFSVKATCLSLPNTFTI